MSRVNEMSDQNFFGENISYGIVSSSVSNQRCSFTAPSSVWKEHCSSIKISTMYLRKFDKNTCEADLSEIFLLVNKTRLF